MNKSLKRFVACTMFSVASLSIAGEYQTNTFGSRSEEGAFIIKSVVTDKFTDHFPKKKWTIVIVSNTYAASDGGGFAHATIGVSPAGPKPIVPKRSFSAYKSVGGSRFLSPRELADLERETIRRATESMMMKCEETARCDVHSPY